MGVTTLFHPVSLNVIRGSLDIHAFKATKIKQLRSSREAGEAFYSIKLIRFPHGFLNQTLRRQFTQLNHCFSDDISVSSINIALDALEYDPVYTVIIKTVVIPMSIEDIEDIHNE